MMFSCLFHRFLTVLPIIIPSFFTKKNKGTFKSHSLVSISLCHSLTVSLSHSHTHKHKHTHKHTNTNTFISVLCVYCLYCLWNMSNNPRVFDDPSKVRGHMAAEISNALLCEAKVRQILINLLPCLWKSLLILHTICLYLCCSFCWSMMF
jgi:hypothetical protein